MKKHIFNRSFACSISSKTLLAGAIIATFPALCAPAFASTLTITAPTTEQSSSLSSTTNLDFDASAGSSAALTIDQTAGDINTTVGGASTTTDGSIDIDLPANGGSSEQNLYFDGSGAMGSGDLSITSNVATTDVFATGDEPLSGSLTISDPLANDQYGTEASLFVGYAPDFEVDSPTTLTLDALTLEGSGTDIDLGSGSTFNVQNLLFDELDTAAETAPDAYINITREATSNDNTVSIGNISFAGGDSQADGSLTLLNLQSGTETFDTPDISAYGVTLENEILGTGQADTVNLQNVTTDAGGLLAEVVDEASGSTTGSSLTVNLGSAVYNDPEIDGDVTLLGVYGSPGDLVFNDFGGTVSGNLGMGGATLNLKKPSDFGGNLTAGGSTVITNGYNALTTVDGSLSANGTTNLLTGSIFNIDGNASFDSAGPAAVLEMGPTASLSIGKSLSAYDTDFILPLSASQTVAPISVGGSYSIQNSNFLINAIQGAYQNGGKYALISTKNGASNAFSSNKFDYVYNGADSSTIDSLKPYVQSTSSGLDLCLGGACVATAPAPTSPSQPAQPIVPVAPIIPVHVVTPVQEAKPVLADAPQVTQADVQNTTQSLVSTGVVGGGPRGLWVKGMGGFSSQSGYQGMNYGLISGYGWSIGQDARDVAGVAFSAGQAGLGTGASDFTKASDYGLWLYGTYYPMASRDWKITGTLGGGMSANTLSSTALGLPQVAHFGGGFMGTEIRASYWRTMDDGIIVSPRLSVGYNQSWTGDYTTHGGGPLDVQVSGQSDGQLYLSPAILVGKKFNYRSTSGNHTIFPQVRLGAVENIGQNTAAEISSGQVAGQVQGLAYPHLQGMAEVRLNVISHTRYSKGLSVNVSARQLFGGGASSTEFIAAIKYHW